MVEGKEAAQDFFARVGTDRVADAVVFGQVFEFVEVVIKTNVGPAVGGEDGLVHLSMEGVEFEKALISSLSFIRFAADLDDQSGSEIAGVKEIVDVGQAEPEVAHEGATVFMIALTVQQRLTHNPSRSANGSLVSPPQIASL